ncbi:MAG: methionine synthase [Clostridia bacterium]|nr:methionine synthase [Clostridia bacterium]
MTPNVDDALRYMGAARADGATRRAMEDIAALLTAKITPRYVFRSFPVEKGPKGAALIGSGLILPGALAGQMLEGCRQAALLMATLGAGFDALLRTYEARDMARAVMLDACGSAYVEAACDEAEREIAARFPGCFLTDRFSPGYGDLPLALQDDFVAALEGEKRLGVQALGSHLLIPAKTVTAVAGISDTPQGARIRGCARCTLRDGCALRKRGKNCGVSI